MNDLYANEFEKITGFKVKKDKDTGMIQLFVEGTKFFLFPYSKRVGYINKVNMNFKKDVYKILEVVIYDDYELSISLTNELKNYYLIL